MMNDSGGSECGREKFEIAELLGPDEYAVAPLFRPRNNGNTLAVDLFVIAVSVNGP